MRLITLLIIAISVVGCQGNPQRHLDQIVAVGGSTVSPAKLAPPVPVAPLVPAPSKYKCENCRDTGWVGDGTVKRRCNEPGCPFVPAKQPPAAKRETGKCKL